MPRQVRIEYEGAFYHIYGTLEVWVDGDGDGGEASPFGVWTDLPGGAQGYTEIEDADAVFDRHDSGTPFPGLPPYDLPEWNAAQRASGGSASTVAATLSRGLYPAGTPQANVWLRAEEPVEEEVRKTLVVVRTTVPASTSGEASAEALGRVTFTIAADGTVSTEATLEGAAAVASAPGNGTITLEAPEIPGSAVKVKLVAPTLIEANTGDIDHDGVPDFADGIQGLLPNEGHRPFSESGSREPETRSLPEMLGAAAFAQYPASTTVEFLYDLSDPYGVVKNPDALGEEPQYVPAPGSLRLWSRNPTVPVNGSLTDRSEADLIRPGQQIPVGQLTKGVYLLLELSESDPAIPEGSLRATATDPSGESETDLLHEDPLDPFRFANASETFVVEFAELPRATRPISPASSSATGSESGIGPGISSSEPGALCALPPGPRPPDSYGSSPEAAPSAASALPLLARGRPSPSTGRGLPNSRGRFSKGLPAITARWPS